MKGKICLLLLVIIASMFAQMLSVKVHALELPPELVGKLHTDLRVAFLVSNDLAWWAVYQKPLPIKYYRSEQVDTAGLYGIKAYDLLVIYRDYGELTIEQINMIVDFVRGGGGLIIGYDGINYLGDSLPILLSKLGITVKVVSGISGYRLVEKDGRAMIDHPVTVGVESIRVYVHNPVIDVEIDKGTVFINSPFIAVAKDFGEGRVIFMAHGERLYEELSGLRLGVNCVEWVAGYSPPGWEPSADSIVGSLREENARLKKLLSGYDELKASYDSLKVSYDKLMADYSSLQSSYSILKTSYDKLKADYDSLQTSYTKLKTDYTSLQASYTSLKSDHDSLKISYDKLKTDYDKLTSDYKKLKSDYDALTEFEPMTKQLTTNINLMCLFIITTVLFIATTVYFAKRKPKTT